MIPLKHYGENCPLSHSFQNQEQTNVRGCKIMPNCTDFKKPNYPTHANSTDVKELPTTRQNYFWIAKGRTEGDARHWTADAEKEWAQWCDTVWICCIWKQWLWLKIGSSCSNRDLFIHSKKSNIMQTFYITEVKLIIWKRILALVLLAIIYLIMKKP